MLIFNKYDFLIILQNTIDVIMIHPQISKPITIVKSKETPNLSNPEILFCKKHTNSVESKNISRIFPKQDKNQSMSICSTINNTIISPKYSELGDVPKPPNILNPPHYYSKNIIELYDDFYKKTDMMYGSSF